MDYLIFRSTRAGNVQASDIHSPLPRSLRTLLMMINGGIDASTLLQKIALLQLDEQAVAELARRGLIEPAFEPNPAASIESPSAFFLRTQAATEQLRGVDVARAYAAGYMRDFAGDANEAFRTLFSTANNEADLRAVVERCTQVILAVEGEGSAAHFTHAVQRLLPAARPSHSTGASTI